MTKSYKPILQVLGSITLIFYIFFSNKNCASCRQPSLTVESLETHKDQLEIAKADLELHSDSFDRTLELILDTDTSGLQQHREQRQGVEECLQICKQLCGRVDTLEAKQKEDDFQDLPARPNKHRNESISTINNYSTGDAVQFMVSTDGTLLNGSNRALGWRARHAGGHLADSTVRQLSRDFTTVNVQSLGNHASRNESDASITVGNRNSSQPISDFDRQYGRGSRLPDWPQLSSNAPAESRLGRTF